MIGEAGEGARPGADRNDPASGETALDGPAEPVRGSGPVPIQSMTGFARFEAEAVDNDPGSVGEAAAAKPLEVVWEVKSVNAKGLDLKLKLPPSLDRLEPQLRALVNERFTRGTIQASLVARERTERPALGVDEATLNAVLAVTTRLVADGHASPPTADGLLAIKGILQSVDPEIGEAERRDRQRRALEGFGIALDRLADARCEEGASLHRALGRRLDRIAALVRQAEADPARTTEAIRARLEEQVAALTGTSQGLDADRLHAEAAFLATRADIGEELDRLNAHLDATRALLSAGGPCGRRLDFLAQEFNREANTICAKANASSLSAIGLELKVAIDQMREQVQNLE